MSSDQHAIEVLGVSKCYHIYQEPMDRLKQYIVPRIARSVGMSTRSYFREFWALRDVSFDLRQGETVGIVGRNGAGKTTLLQIISGTVAPTEGGVRVAGKVAALLALGAAFNPELTGRENVYLSARSVGVESDEIDERWADIAAFAEIGDFVDQPVKTYSSGMFVRLAFASSVMFDPEILVVDEALSVGDARFQAKCFRRIHELQQTGTTILFVSHSTEQIVRHCERALLLEGGRMLELGSPKFVTNRYLDILHGSGSGYGGGATDPICGAERHAGSGDLFEGDAFAADTVERYDSRPGYSPNEYRWGDGRARILDFRVTDSDGRDVQALDGGGAYDLWVKILFCANVDAPILGFFFKTIDGIKISGANSKHHRDSSSKPFGPCAAGDLVCGRFRLRMPMSQGDYLLSLGVAEDIEEDLIPLDRRYDSILVKVNNTTPEFGLVDLDIRCTVLGLMRP